jgi:hypothetical protein
MIDRLVPLAGMKKLRILSLGRNQIKRVRHSQTFGIRSIG